MSKVKLQKQEIKVKDFLNKSTKYNFDHVVQRRGVWDIGKKSLFVHSLLTGYPFGVFHALDEKGIDGNPDILYLLDGKQRLTTLLEFCRNEFALANDTPELTVEKVENEETIYEEADLAGLKFEQLDKDLQNEILYTPLVFQKISNADEEDVEQIFYRLNNGMPLSKIEITRALASTSVMGFVKEIADRKFFRETVQIASSQRNRFADQELVLQCLMLLLDEEVSKGFSGNEIRQFALELKDKGITEETKQIMRETTDYLESALPDKVKFLKKANVPIIFVHAIRAQKEGIPAIKFGGWIIEFSAKVKAGKTSKDEAGNVLTSYGLHSQSGTAKREKIIGRITEMAKDYVKNINTAPDYFKPEPAQSGTKKSDNKPSGEPKGEPKDEQKGEASEMAS